MAPEAIVTDLNPPMIEADDAVTSDWDGESVVSSTLSLTDSILEHVYENGRRYHLKTKDQYLHPTDETEQDRLDMMHHLHLEIQGGNTTLTKFTEDPANVLDCGCGTGIWALEFGDLHKGSQVIGLDLAPIQPGWTAPNVKFELDDLEKEWTFKENFFNFIHSRHLAVSIKDWPRYMRQMHKHTALGGYIEIVEHTLDSFLCDDDTMPPDSAYHAYWDALLPCYDKLGVNPRLRADDYKQMLEAAGFVDVQVNAYKIPIGGWPKDKKKKRMGQIFAEIAATGAEAYAFSLLTTLGGRSVEEARKIVDGGVRAVREAREHAYYFEYYLTARKAE